VALGVSAAAQRSSRHCSLCHEPNLDGHCPGWALSWMGIVAGSSPLRRHLPWHRAATYGTATIPLALGELVLAAPQALPGLTVPGHQIPCDGIPGSDAH
jgi:hypothetical protein